METPEESVGIADCQRVSHDLSALLDVEDEFGQDDLGETYTLEVSSPGLDRALRHERDYRRFAGLIERREVLEALTEAIERRAEEARIARRQRGARPSTPEPPAPGGGGGASPNRRAPRG